MATSKKTTASAKRASTAKPRPARKTSAAAAKGAADAAPDIRKALTKPLKDLGARLQSLNVSGAAGAVAEARRKDLKALVSANKKSYEGLQSTVKRQTEMLRESITEWKSAVKAMPGSDPREAIGKLDELGRASFKRALDDIRELAEMAAKSQAEAFEIVRERIQDNVEEVRQLLDKRSK